VATEIPNDSKTALDRFPTPSVPRGHPVTVAEVLPKINGGEYCALITELDLKIDHRFARIETLDSLFSHCGLPRSEQSLQRIRSDFTLTEGSKRLSSEVRSLLECNSPRGRWAFVRCWDDPEKFLWRVERSDFLRSPDLPKYLPHPYGEYEITDEGANWFLRMRDDDPFIFLAAPASLIDQLDKECGSFSLRVSGNFLYAA